MPDSVDRLLARIDYQGPREPCRQTLDSLQKKFMRQVPFENLDIHLGRRIVLDERRVWHKIVDQHRGGWCFELNEVFRWLLTELGFTVSRAASGVLLDGGDAGEFNPFDHLTLLVHLDGRRYLSDVGFGDNVQCALDIDDPSPHSDGRAQYRINPTGARFQLERLESRAWAPQHSVDVVSRAWSDFSQRCEFLQTSPASKFARKRVCSLVGKHGLVSLTGNTLNVAGRQSDVAEAKSHDVLLEHFGVDIAGGQWIRPI